MTPNTASQEAGAIPESSSPEVEQLLARVADLVSTGKAKAAVDLIGRSKLASARIRNALGVCHLRLGHIEAAVNLYRGMVVSGLALRDDAPLVAKTNYATALLLHGNVSGGLSVLTEIGAASPAVQKLHAAIERWKTGLSLWQKLQWYTGGELSSPVPLDFPPGDLE